jgi:hypothetical protein
VTGRGLASPVLVIGVLLIAVARLAFPAAPPLYDGVVPIEPYVWLDPPAGQPAGAKGATAEIAVRNGKSPLVAVATPELVPQAQIFAPPGGLTVPVGVRTIHVSIEPVPIEELPTGGHVDGNVYRIEVVDQTGTALTAPASARVSVVLRATDPAQAEATIGRFSSGSWQMLATSMSGFGGTFISVVTGFGDFAVIQPGADPGTAVTGAPPSSAAASIVTSGPLLATNPAPISNAPTSPGGRSGVADWLPPALAAIALAVVIAVFRVATRHRRGPYRGAHRIRRR